MHPTRHLIIDGLNVQHGGGMTVMVRLANAFTDAQYKVTILVSRDLPIGITDQKIKIKTIPSAGSALRAAIFRYFKLNALCLEYNTDIILTFNYHSKTDIPQITYHINVIPFLSTFDRIRLVGLTRAIIQRHYAIKALRKSHLNVFESRYVKNLACMTYAEISNLCVAYIGVDTPSEPPMKDPARWKGPLVSITSGARHKQNQLTVEVFRRLSAIHPEKRLDIIGNADAIRKSLPVELCDYAQKCPRINFTGYLDRAQLYAILSRASALVTFSEFESFFMVAVEAMGVGCPVVAPDISSIRESVGPAGLLISPGDLDAAVQLLSELETSEIWLSASRKSRDWAKQFDAADCSKAFVSTVNRSLLPGAQNGTKH